jgi:hypothetical protein
MANEGSSVLNFLLVIAVIILGFFLSSVYRSDEAKTAQIARDEARITDLESKEGMPTELKSEMSELDKNLSHLQHLLNPNNPLEASSEPTQQVSDVAKGLYLADGLYKVDMTEPKGCDPTFSQETEVVCVESIVFSTAKNETALHIHFEGSKDVPIDSAQFKADCHLEDETGEVGDLKSVNFERQPNGSTIAYLTFNQRLAGQSRHFQLAWPEKDQSTTIKFGLL